MRPQGFFANKLEDMVEFLIPKYAQEGKTSLVIAVGCTGGKHRSVTIARELYSRIARNGEYGFDWSTEMWIKIAY